jgi:hypothetical protein
MVHRCGDVSISILMAEKECTPIGKADSKWPDQIAAAEAFIHVWQLALVGIFLFVRQRDTHLSDK